MPGLHQLRLEAQTFYRLATERSDILASNGYKKGICEVKGNTDNEKEKKSLPAASGGEKKK